MLRKCLLHEVIRTYNPLEQTSVFLILAHALRVILDSKVGAVAEFHVTCEGLREAGLDAHTCSFVIYELKTRFHRDSERFLDFTSRTLHAFIVDACMEEVIVALIDTDTLPIANGRGPFDHSKTHSAIHVGHDVETLHLLTGIANVAANKALRLILKGFVVVEYSCIATRH